MSLHYSNKNANALMEKNDSSQRFLEIAIELVIY
jgi:hypothetical protein